jgi:hypothetical protein
MASCFNPSTSRVGSSYPAYIPAGDAVAYVDTRNGVSNVVEAAAQERQARTTDPFQRRRNLIDCVHRRWRLFASRGHTTSEVLLIKDFQARN